MSHKVMTSKVAFGLMNPTTRLFYTERFNFPPLEMFLSGTFRASRLINSPQ